MVEQKYTTLQEEYQKMLRKSRDSASSARDISSIDQLQELDVKYQFKTQLCREQVTNQIRPFGACKYSQHPITRTLKGMKNLFELSNGFCMGGVSKGKINLVELSNVRPDVDCSSLSHRVYSRIGVICLRWTNHRFLL